MALTRPALFCLWLTGLPPALLAPLLAGWPSGPFLHTGGAGSARYLDLWATLSLASAVLLVVPAASSAYRWRGLSAAGAVVAFLVIVSVTAWHVGVWWA